MNVLSCSQTYPELDTKFSVQSAAGRRWVWVAESSWACSAESLQSPGSLPTCCGDCTVGSGHLGLPCCGFFLYRTQQPEIANTIIHITLMDLFKISNKMSPPQAPLLPYSHDSVSQWHTALPGKLSLKSVSTLVFSVSRDLSEQPACSKVASLTLLIFYPRHRPFAVFLSLSSHLSSFRNRTPLLYFPNPINPHAAFNLERASFQLSLKSTWKSAFSNAPPL